jgi:hypothetical protein
MPEVSIHLRRDPAAAVTVIRPESVSGSSRGCRGAT